MSQATAIGPDVWAGLDALRIVDVVEAVGLKRHEVRKIEKAGLLRPLDRRGPKGALLISREDALFLLGVAALAIAAGMALVTMARLLREADATVSQNGITIPFSEENRAARLIA